MDFLFWLLQPIQNVFCIKTFKVPSVVAEGFETVNFSKFSTWKALVEPAGIVAEIGSLDPLTKIDTVRPVATPTPVAAADNWRSVLLWFLVKSSKTVTSIALAGTAIVNGIFPVKLVPEPSIVWFSTKNFSFSFSYYMNP